MYVSILAALTFHAFLSLKYENGDLGTKMGTQKLKKVPMGTRSPKWGPMWLQCSGTILGLSFQPCNQLAKI